MFHHGLSVFMQFSLSDSERLVAFVPIKRTEDVFTLLIVIAVVFVFI